MSIINKKKVYKCQFFLHEEKEKSWKKKEDKRNTTVLYTVNPYPMATANSSPLALEDRIAIVTGSSRGIGKAIALHLASLGAKLVINFSSNRDQADLLVRQINSSANGRPRAISVQANVSDPSQVKSLFDEAERIFGSQVSVLVNCAGVLDSKYPSIANTSLEDFEHTFRYLFQLLD